MARRLKTTVELTYGEFAEIEHLRLGWARSDAMLRKIYNHFGPKMRGGKAFPTGKYASMTEAQVDTGWDFADRHLMHEVAKVLESE